MAERLVALHAIAPPPLSVIVESSMSSELPSALEANEIAPLGFAANVDPEMLT